MTQKILLIASLMLPLAGCVITPRIELAEHFDFNAPMPDRTPMSYNDLLCCFECHA